MDMGMIRKMMIVAAVVAAGCRADAERVEPLPFGDMERWVTRNITESIVLGGNRKTVYAIGPEVTIEGNKAYVPAKGNPWATSNVYAKVCGIVKASNMVSPGKRPDGGRCAVLSTDMEHCKVIGVIDVEIVVSGSIFLGQMIEPIRSTSNPYSKMEMGIPFTGRPSFLQFDYSLHNPGTGILTEATGRKPRTRPGHDSAEVFIFLQHRWEDAKGNIYATRVATGRERYRESTDGWVKGHRLPIHYGDISGQPFYRPYMGLIPQERSYYARNSKGKMVPVQETGWAPEGASVTHMLVMASSGCGAAYTGTVGMEFSVDNFALVY